MKKTASPSLLRLSALALVAAAAGACGGSNDDSSDVAVAFSGWAQQSGEATAYAPLVRLRPLAGHAAKPIIYQLAKGDTVMTNTRSGMVVRGGALADPVRWFRHDLAFGPYLENGVDPAALEALNFLP